ncbi:unnamed protein product [Ectocarpus sp. CCAP 1310/34]|nr:unnamed protein product [Ectocarpus sp. CCAP 1310/34]
MRATWATANSHFSATRYLAATLLFFAPHAALPAKALPETPKLVRRQLAFASSQRQHLRGCSSSSTTSSSISRARVGSSSGATKGTVRAGSTAATVTGRNTMDGSNSNAQELPSLPSFLETCSSKARRQQQGHANAAKGTAETETLLFHVFSGNEACDADSMCSAIGMAFLKQATAALAAEDDGGDVVHVPVMPIPRRDLALRREVLVLFELCDVDPSAIVFADELDLHALQAEGRLRLTLTDHNAVSGGLSGLGDAVVEIVDHHVDLGEHPSVQGSRRNVAFEANDGGGKALVGSCCTIVAERMLDQAPALLSSDVAQLLLGVILVDTLNLDMEIKRATSRDIAAAQELSRRVSWLPPVAQDSGECSPSSARRCCTTADELFDTLRNAKFDPAFWREISATDTLRYDYKSFHAAGESGGTSRSHDDRQDHDKPPRPLKFGMSSTLCRLETLAEKGGYEGFGDAMRTFAVSQGVDSLAVMTSTLDEEGNMQKELLIFTHTKLRGDQMREYLEGAHGEFLELEAATPPGTDFGGRGDEVEGSEEGARGWFLRWDLRNVRASRKQVAPVIASFYESVAGR